MTEGEKLPLSHADRVTAPLTRGAKGGDTGIAPAGKQADWGFAVKNGARNVKIPCGKVLDFCKRHDTIKKIGGLSIL